MSEQRDGLLEKVAEHEVRLSNLEKQMADISAKLDTIQEHQLDDVKKTNYTLVVLLITVVGTLTNVILHFI